MQYKLYKEAVFLLKSLISTQSFSGSEDQAADNLQSYLKMRDVNSHRYLNNIWAFNRSYDLRKPSILLNSHIDTVKPNSGYTLDPYHPLEQDGKLYGLGSNDAGGSLVSLVAAFLYFNENYHLKYNLILAITAEEETSGKNGLGCVLPKLPKFDFAIVGEPTGMQLAIAEKGLMVLDCVAQGVSGHAARNEGLNAITVAIEDINWFHTYQFPKESRFLGPVKMSVTVINGGSQHNVVPDKCNFSVDVRVNEYYSNEEVLEIVRSNVKSNVHPRSTNLRSSSIDVKHPIVLSGISLGRKIYGSPTTSDQVKINAPSLKLGPGDSARSHIADEFIYLNEIEEGINIYIEMLRKVIEK